MSSELSKAYNRLAAKYMFLLDKLDDVSKKLDKSKVDIKEVQRIICNAINEVILKFPA